MRFTSRLISKLCALFFASSAYAATLVAITHQPFYPPGASGRKR